MELLLSSVSAADREHPTRHCTDYGVSQTQLKQLPAGSTPPLILAYSASSVPVLQLAFIGQNLSEQQLTTMPEFYSDAAHHRAGASVPYPYGGKHAKCRWI